jgi:hypothetical protein
VYHPSPSPAQRQISPAPQSESLTQPYTHEHVPPSSAPPKATSWWHAPCGNSTQSASDWQPPPELSIHVEGVAGARQSFGSTRWIVPSAQISKPEGAGGSTCACGIGSDPSQPIGVSPVVSSLVDPSLVDPLVDPSLVDPSLVDPSLVDPLVDPLVEPSLVDPAVPSSSPPLPSHPGASATPNASKIE